MTSIFLDKVKADIAWARLAVAIQYNKELKRKEEIAKEQWDKYKVGKVIKK